MRWPRSLGCSLFFCLAPLVMMVSDSATRAETIDVTFTGTVIDTHSMPDGLFHAGQSLSGSYRLEFVEPMSDRTYPYHAEFNDVISTLTLNIGDYTSTTTDFTSTLGLMSSSSTWGTVRIKNSDPQSGRDEYVTMVIQPAAMIGPDIVDDLAYPVEPAGPGLSKYPLDLFQIQLFDFFGTVFSDAQKFPKSLSLSDFEGAHFDLSFKWHGLLTGTIDSMTFTSAPEPSSALFICMGLTGMLLRRPRFRKKTVV